MQGGRALTLPRPWLVVAAERQGARCARGSALRTLEFARTAGKARGAENQDVLVDDQVPGLAAGAGLADVVELEERRARDELPATDPGQQRHAPLDRNETRGAAGLHDGAGEVDQLAPVPPGPGGDHGDAAGPQQYGAPREDLGDAVDQVV